LAARFSLVTWSPFLGLFSYLVNPYAWAGQPKRRKLSAAVFLGNRRGRRYSGHFSFPLGIVDALIPMGLLSDGGRLPVTLSSGDGPFGPGPETCYTLAA